MAFFCPFKPNPHVLARAVAFLCAMQFERHAFRRWALLVRTSIGHSRRGFPPSDPYRYLLIDLTSCSKRSTSLLNLILFPGNTGITEDEDEADEALLCDDDDEEPRDFERLLLFLSFLCFLSLLCFLSFLSEPFGEPRPAFELGAGEPLSLSDASADTATGLRE